MQWREAAFGAALVMVAGTAAAQSRPPFPPTTDAAVTYRVESSARGVPPSIEVRWSAAAGRMRVDGGMPGYALLDPAAGTAVVVLEGLGVMLDAPRAAGVDQLASLEHARRFVRRGTTVVAGTRCTEYEVSGRDAVGTACLTPEGVPLRLDGQDERGRTAHLEATSVSLAPQDPAIFQPPPGVRRVNTAALGKQALQMLLQGQAGGLAKP